MHLGKWVGDSDQPIWKDWGKRVWHGPEQKLIKVTMHMKNSKRFRLTAVYNA